MLFNCFHCLNTVLCLLMNRQLRWLQELLLDDLLGLLLETQTGQQAEVCAQIG